MLISSALAASDLPPEMAEAPSMTDAFLYNAGFILLVVIVFYLVFIMPQQKRLAAQNEMLKGLKKGDRVVTVMRSYLDKLNDKVEEPASAKAATKAPAKAVTKASSKSTTKTSAKSTAKAKK